MNNWPIVGDFILTFNVLAFTVPIVASYGSYKLVASGGKFSLLGLVAAFAVYGLTMTALYLLHAAIGFPVWMHNFN